MPDAVPPDVGEDAAWVAVDTTLSPTQLLALLDHAEGLLRINSQWVFDTWQWLDIDRFELSISNLSNGKQWQTTGRLHRTPDGLRLDYDDGLKASTRFRVEPVGQGTRLWIIDDYGRLSEEQRRTRTDEVDRSLPGWGQDLRRYLSNWARWSHSPLWRWYMERVWQPMTPLGRRVTRLVIGVTVVELLVFVLLVAVLVNEKLGK